MGEDSELARWRGRIDEIDGALVALLAERFEITREVGEWKARNDVAPVDPDRERRQVERLRRLASETGLDADFLERFFRIIIDEVVGHHRKLRGEIGEPPYPFSK